VANGARIPPADAWARKQIERAAAAGNDWLEGTLNPRRDPVQAALAANDRRIARIQQSIADKTWEGAMARVDPAATEATIKAVGSQGYANGVRARTDKIQAAVARLQPLVAAHVAKLDQLPAKSDADMEARMVANLRGMRGIGKQYKTGR